MTPRVHVTDARVEAEHRGGRGGRPRRRRRRRRRGRRARARALRRGGRPERRGAPPDAREREFWRRLQRGARELCLTPAARTNTDVACSANLFNEFSTVDAGVVWGDRVVFRLARDVDAGDPAAARRLTDWTSAGLTTASARRQSHLATGRCPAQSPLLGPRCPTGGGSASDVVELEVVLDDDGAPPLALRPRLAGQARVAAFAGIGATARRRAIDVCFAAAAGPQGRGGDAVGLPLVQRAPTPSSPLCSCTERVAGARSAAICPGGEEAGVAASCPATTAAASTARTSGATLLICQTRRRRRGGAPPALAATAGHFNWGVWDALPCP